MAKPLKSKIVLADENELIDIDILEDLKNAAATIKTGQIKVMPSLYARDDLSVLWVSPRNFMKLKRGLDDTKCGAV